MRLLNAAKKFKIVPVGFIAGQLQSERSLGEQPAARPSLPSGFVTMLMTDIEGSTALVHRLGARYRELIDEVWSILRGAVADAGGHEVEARADEFFAVFESPRSPSTPRSRCSSSCSARSWVDDLDVRVRIGIHSGYPTSTEPTTSAWTSTRRRASARSATAARSWSPPTRGRP